MSVPAVCQSGDYSLYVSASHSRRLSAAAQSRSADLQSALEFGHFPSMCPITHCTLLIAHLRMLLGPSLKTLRTRTDLAATNPDSMPNEQCPMSNEQSQI
jgi:hypothetical protein